MIIIGGTVQFETVNEDALFDAIRRMMSASQAEDGCIAYEFSRDMSKPNLLHLYEVWEDAASLDAHGVAPHFDVFRKEAFPYFTATDITRYDAKVAEK